MNDATKLTLEQLLADRRADCTATEVHSSLDVEITSMQCERCGIGWRDGAGPPCFPVITFDEMARAAERARGDLMRMQRNGATLGGYQLTDMAAFAATLRLLDLVTGDGEIMRRVKEIGKAARARSERQASERKAAARASEGEAQ